MGFGRAGQSYLKVEGCGSPGQPPCLTHLTNAAYCAHHTPHLSEIVLYNRPWGLFYSGPIVKSLVFRKTPQPRSPRPHRTICFDTQHFDHCPLIAKMSFDNIVLEINTGNDRFTRLHGIKECGRALARPEKWESMWKAMGGTKGVISIFEKISVAELVALVGIIGRCNRGRNSNKEATEEREKTLEEFICALLPSHYPESKFRSLEKRPVENYYARMVPACSADFVNRLLDEKDQSNPLYRYLPAERLLKDHGELLRKRVVKALFGNGAKDNLFPDYLEAFVYNRPPLPGLDPKLSASMEFSMKILKVRLENIRDERFWPSTISETKILFSLFQRALKRRLPEDKLHEIIMLGLRLIEAKPTLSQGQLWSIICTRWLLHPKVYDDAVVLSLRLGLGGSQKMISCRFLQSSKAMKKPETKWLLLRLFCLYVPGVGIDLDTADDLTLLAGQPWSCDVFYQLNKNQAVRLLNGLRRANPQYPFLQKPNGYTSILSNSTKSNFNAILLSTILSRGSDVSQQKTIDAVDELRRDSVIAREQSDRANKATAASDYAIASGNIDLYSETITWQQRYVRDPLTVKTIFGKSAVTTREGLELLSGIPQPLPENITLSQIAKQVEKANTILMTFHENMDIARGEPSFYLPDWAGVSSMFGLAISQRVVHATTLRKHLYLQSNYENLDDDVYDAIWRDTFAMLENVNVDFLNQATSPIQILLQTLTSTALAATTTAMLDSGNEKRKKRDRQPTDAVLERLSYDGLVRLTKGRNPELAQQLVLRTILDRPDASSWHRQLLSASFMKSLPAKDAQEMLLAFSTAIGKKLEEQSYIKVGEAQLSKSAPPQSIVKVTTVKYLAQLLDNAQFISANAAVEVLVELFKAGTHIDIRLATLDSLLGLLNTLCGSAGESWRSNDLVEKILESLETVIPVVGSVNERRPPREEDWQDAITTNKLPNITDISSGLPPLLHAVLVAPNSTQYPWLKKLKPEFLERFVLPILTLSQSEHRKWVSLFLSVHKSNLLVKDLPPTPVTPLVWRNLVDIYPHFLPQTVLEDYNKFFVMTINPPAAMEGFNLSLKNDIELKNTPAVQHWLSIFDKNMTSYSSAGTKLLVAMIHHDLPRTLISNGISFDIVLEMVLTHASLLLERYEDNPTTWEHFANDLRPPMKLIHPHSSEESIRKMASTWQQTGRLVLERVLALVLDKKSRSPRYVPSMTRPRLWLLPYPCFPEKSEVDSQCKQFAKEMEKLLNVFLKGEANVLRWPKIAEHAIAASELLNTAEDRLRVASYIGRMRGFSNGVIDQKDSALNLLRVTLSMRLIEDGKSFLHNDLGLLSEQRDEFVLRLRGIVNSWNESSEDAIREKVVDWKREHSIWETLMVEKKTHGGHYK